MESTIFSIDLSDNTIVVSMIILLFVYVYIDHQTRNPLFIERITKPAERLYGDF